MKLVIRDESSVKKCVKCVEGGFSVGIGGSVVWGVGDGFASSYVITFGGFGGYYLSFLIDTFIFQMIKNLWIHL